MFQENSIEACMVSRVKQNLLRGGTKSEGLDFLFQAMKSREGQ